MYYLFFFFFGNFKIEEQQKKALEEDPSVFDYDGVYDEMKEKSIHHKVLDRRDTKVISYEWHDFKLYI